MADPVIRFRIDFAKNSHVGPGKIDLLEAIRTSGSLSQAARDLGMSYRRAWLLVDSFKAAFREPVTSSTTGGKGGGGVTLTRFGEELVTTYRALELEIAALAAQRLRGITAAVTTQSGSKPAGARRPLARRTPRP
jgi:molybdate transport system regulatory protein